MDVHPTTSPGQIFPDERACTSNSDWASEIGLQHQHPQILQHVILRRRESAHIDIAGTGRQSFPKREGIRRSYPTSSAYRFPKVPTVVT